MNRFIHSFFSLHRTLLMVGIISPVVFAASAGAATLSRIADAGNVYFDTSFCVFPNCYNSTQGAGNQNLAPNDEIDFSYRDGFINLTTAFDSTHIYTHVESRPFSRTPLGGGVTWGFTAGDHYANRTATFQLDEQTYARISGQVFGTDFIGLFGSAGQNLLAPPTGGPTYDQTVVLDSGRYELSVRHGGMFAFSGMDLTLQLVPLPAAVWFFGSALGLMGVMRRKVTA
jgi:hypothetical protein